MSDKMRWRYGDTNPVVAAVDAKTVIEIGDLVWQDTDDAKPAGSFTWDTDLVTTQDGFADKFLGVAMQRSRSGDTAPIRVATTGVFEFDCASGTFELGEMVGPAGNTGGTALMNQQVAKVAASHSRRAAGQAAARGGHQHPGGRSLDRNDRRRRRQQPQRSVSGEDQDWGLGLRLLAGDRKTPRPKAPDLKP